MKISHLYAFYTSIFQRVLFDSKAWCIGTPYPPFSTLWKIQVVVRTYNWIRNAHLPGSPWVRLAVNLPIRRSPWGNAWCLGGRLTRWDRGYTCLDVWGTMTMAMFIALFWAYCLLCWVGKILTYLKYLSMVGWWFMFVVYFFEAYPQENVL